MDREYLEDYKQKEEAAFERFLKNLREGKPATGKDKYPPDERFVNLQRPVAIPEYGAENIDKIWAQIPFCGSLILHIPPIPRDLFEKHYFKVSEIPTIIDFVKETGKLQIVLNRHLKRYEGLDFLDPFFTELDPPIIAQLPLTFFADSKKIAKAKEIFLTLGDVKYFNFIMEKSLEKYIDTGIPYLHLLLEEQEAYTILKLRHPSLAECFEDLMVDEPRYATYLLLICSMFIINPFKDMRCDVRNLTLEETRLAGILPAYYRLKNIRFPCEIGKFLLSKLTYAPTGMRACNELIDHYDAYDLQKLLESLNSAIVASSPDILNETANGISQTLDNVWKDKTIPRRIKGLKAGIPLSMAALGSVAAGPIGTAVGLLGGLGYTVADKFIDLGTEGLSERLAKLKTRSYQVNIYDFKKKYRTSIAH